ncbi:hypothetical protein LSH36_491g01040 [Paralvinella palmiformis]|uniref:Uncharacterized protein n=1 Tax=Paralvinella palmiformis TaxID=53620 RepID=A0AAD9J934_9ANNE|nr:hypothetical protein LSH36_491g01040 [Paralvinella palmiformis]
MSDIAFSMSLDNTDRLRFTSSSCQEDYKKGSISLAAFTIVIVTKVMYIVLITQILLLIAISFLLPKGIFKGQTAAVYTKTILYVIFLMTERNTARYNSRNPEQAIITISGRLAPADPDSLFKLPTYEEATVNSSSPQNTDEDHLDKPPPNKPPDYSP